MLELYPRRYEIDIESDLPGWEYAAGIDPQADASLFYPLAETIVKKGTQVLRLVEFLGVVGGVASLADINVVARRSGLEPAEPGDLLSFFLLNPQAPPVCLTKPYVTNGQSKPLYFWTTEVPYEGGCDGSCFRACRAACHRKPWFRDWLRMSGSRSLCIRAIEKGGGACLNALYLFKEVPNKNHPSQILE